MTGRQRAWPRQWLMTDERMGDRLWEAVARLPDHRAGIVLRHHATSAEERHAVADRLAIICRSRGLTLGVAVDSALATSVGADFIHNPAGLVDGPISMSVHTLDQALAARRRYAALVFVSPVYPTRSHPERPALGVDGAQALADSAGTPAIALGGMTGARFAALPAGVFHGWAGIDAWLSGSRD